MSEEALKWIEECKRKKAKKLDLRNLGLEELPMELAELTWLEELELGFNPITRPPTHPSGKSDNFFGDSPLGPLGPLTALRTLELWETQVADISPLKGMAQLQVLDLSGTQVADISPLTGMAQLQELRLSGTRVADISPLQGMARLQWLHLRGTRVADISPLRGMARLQRLDLSGTRVADISPLKGMAQLQELDLSRTQVADISPLKGMAQLQWLDLSGTQVADISPLRGMAQLQALHLSWTQVADISPLRGMIEKGLHFSVDGCPLTNPPIEIAWQGNEAILSYWTEQERQGPIRLMEAKVVLVGDAGAGKTSLLNRLLYPKRGLPAEDKSTRGIEIHAHSYPVNDRFSPAQATKAPRKTWWQIWKPRSVDIRSSGGDNMRLNFWDFGGQQIYHSTHQFFLTKRTVYVLVDDSRRDNTQREEDGYTTWLEMLELKAGGSPIVFFQNIRAGRSKELAQSNIQRRFPAVRNFFKGDLSERSSANEVFDFIKEVALGLDHVGQLWPKKWLAVRQELERIGLEKPHISLAEYLGIYADKVERNDQKALELSQYLHDLGVVLHFQGDQTLKHLVILQSHWATNAVFRVLDYKAVEERNGYFTREHAAAVWGDAHYRDCHDELRQLMVNFELCYALPAPNQHTWLVPQLLRPEPLASDFVEEAGDTLVYFQYTKSMPAGLVNRLMVRRNELVRRPEMAWRTGVLFERETTKVLVDAPFAAKRIRFRAKGPDSLHLLSVLTHELEALNSTFEGLGDSVRKMVPCICKDCGQLLEPFAHDYDDLRRNHQRNGATAVTQCKTNYAMVKVADLLRAYPFYTGKSRPPSDGNMKKIFISYSSKDQEFKDAFEAHLSPIVHFGNRLEIWQMGLIKPSDDWNAEVQTALEEADIVVMLLSPSFFASKYIREEEFVNTLERRKAGGCLVAGIVIRACTWDTTPLKDIQLVAKGKVIGKPENDEGWVAAVRDLERVL